MVEEYGYDPSRFDSPMLEQFICPICTQVAKNPKECRVCGSLFCFTCVSSWLKKKSECPRAKCDLQKNPLQEISGALRRIYNGLDVHCQYENCGKKLIKLCDLEKHEETCAMPKCKNFDVCEKNVSQNLKDQGVCDLSCLLLQKIRSQNGDQSKILKEIKDFLQKYGQGGVDYVGQGGGNYMNVQIMQPIQSGGGGGNGGSGQITNFRWDKQACGTGIELSNNNCTAFLKESAYMFRTVISDNGMFAGIYYWEIIADPRTENELKIGIATKRDFNYNSAFCDYEFGYAYYGLGQLRQNSNAAGPQYGKRFKKEGTLGLCLDMNKGTLSLALDGDFWGVAYQNPALKKGPIFAAVSLLHCAGCRLQTGKAVPQYFLQ